MGYTSQSAVLARAPGLLQPPLSRRSRNVAPGEERGCRQPSLRQAPCLASSPGLLEEQSGAQNGAAVGCQIPDSAQPRKPGFPPTRPSARSEASDTPAGARPPLLARAASRPALCGAERTWRLLSPLPPGALGGQWRLLNGGGIAHARKASAPHSGIALPLWVTSRGSASRDLSWSFLYSQWRRLELAIPSVRFENGKLP